MARACSARLFSYLHPGGGSGIGAAVCRCFAKNGAKVAVVDIHKERAIRTADELAGNIWPTMVTAISLS